MRKVVATMLLLVGVLGRAEAAEIEFGRYYALIIGINDYERLPRLETAVNDASALHDLLRRDYGYQSTLLLNPTRPDLLRALESVRTDLTEKDNLLLFYAGHSYLDRATNDGFWLPTNADPESQVEWVPVTTVTRILKASAAKHVLVVVDSCYSGTLTRDAPIVLKVGAERAAELQRISEKRARKALTSGGLEPVDDGGGDGHSVFARALLQLLQGNRRVLDGYQLYHDLRRAVVANAAQTPEYGDIRFAGDEGGDFLFVPVVTRPAVEQAAAPARATPSDEPGAGRIELAFWQAIQDSTAASDYEAYLTQFPDGYFAPLARARAQRFAKAKPPEAEPPPRPAEPIALEPVERFYIALNNANVREGPTVDSPAVTTLERGSELYVAGRTADGKWLKVERDSRPLGFVYAPLLRDWEEWNEARRRQEEARQREEQARRKAEQEATRRELEATARHAREALARQEEAEAAQRKADEAARVAPREAGATAPQTPREAGKDQTVASLSPAPVGQEELEAYLRGHRKEFLDKVSTYAYAHDLVPRSASGFEFLPKKVHAHRVVPLADGRFRVDVTVEGYAAQNYAGSPFRDFELQLVVVLERLGSGAAPTIVGHED